MENTVNITIDDIIRWGTAIISVASVATNLIPGETDNKIVKVVKAAFDTFALNFRKNK